MRRSRASLAAPVLPGTVLGVPTPLLLLGLGAAALLAVSNSGAADSTATSGASPTGNDTGAGSSTPATSGRQPAGSSSATPATVKKKRRAIVAAASPSLYIFIDSVGGEGIFDRLRTSFSLQDGYGLDRVATLSNGEFAGYATGRTWKPADSATVYLELWQQINGTAYNYWIEQSQTKALHGNSIPADINSSTPSWANVSLYQLGPMSATTKLLIQNFYWSRYTS